MKLGLITPEVKAFIDAEVATSNGKYETIITQQRAMLEDLELKRSGEVGRLQKQLVRAKKTNTLQAKYDLLKKAHDVSNKLIETLDEDRKRF